MLQTPSLNLSTATATHLSIQQVAILSKGSYQDQIVEVNKLWANKKSTSAKKIAFQEIEKALREMAVAQCYCCYCEHGELYDIEHIFPKSFFPDFAYIWDNYLYVCKECNFEKLHKFQIFNPLGSANVVTITRYKGGSYTVPATKDNVLINPRAEDPMDLLVLDLGAGTFEAAPAISNRDKIRAEYTKSLLKLNKREALVTARKHACYFFWTELKNYAKISQATSVEILQEVIDEIRFAPPYTCTNLERYQARLCLEIQEKILTSAHQTVWKEMQRQYNNPEYPLLTSFFTKVPETLNW